MNKIDFFHFLIKNCADQLASAASFLQPVKKFQKWLFQDLLEGLKWKVTKYEHATFNKLELADDKRLGGVSDTPPSLFRVKEFSKYPRL